MIKILNDSDAELTARLLVAMDTLDAESFTVSRLESLLVSVRALNHEAVQSMHAGLSAELQELAQHEAGFQLSLFQFAIPDDVLALHPLVGISPDAVYAAAMARPFQGRLLSEWASSLESDRMARISNTVRQGFLLGDTHEQIARKVRGHANRGYQDGALQMSRTNAGSVAKTAVGHLAATARTSLRMLTMIF
ncbi:Phage Mu protein F like protein [Raoultella ornithinolytica]|nr:Phage Mu protein F like protein [Raoultella ornithinolytica]